MKILIQKWLLCWTAISCVITFEAATGLPCAGDEAADRALADKLFKESLVAEDRKQTDLAISLLERVIKLRPQARNAYLNLAILYERDKKNYARAEQLIKKAIAIAPTDFGYRWEYALIMIGQGRLSDALALLKQSSSLRKTSVEERLLKRKIFQLEQDLHVTKRPRLN